MRRRTEQLSPLIATTHALIYINNHVLLALRQNTGYADGFFGLIGGRVEPQESVLDGMLREIHEEIGVKAHPEHAKLVGIIPRKEADCFYLNFIYHIHLWDGEIINNEPEKTAYLKLFPLNKLPANIVSHAKKAIENHQENIFYSVLASEKLLNPY